MELIPFTPLIDFFPPHNAALPLPKTLGNNSLFALEKRVIGPFQGVISTLFDPIPATCRGPTPARQGASATAAAAASSAC